MHGGVLAGGGAGVADIRGAADDVSGRAGGGGARAGERDDREHGAQDGGAAGVSGICGFDFMIESGTGIARPGGDEPAGDANDAPAHGPGTGCGGGAIRGGDGNRRGAGGGCDQGRYHRAFPAGADARAGERVPEKCLPRCAGGGGGADACDPGERGEAGVMRHGAGMRAQSLARANPLECGRVMSITYQRFF